MFTISGFSLSAFEGLDKLIQMYHDVDTTQKGLNNIPGLQCPQGCSRCCHTSAANIEVTIFELIPLCLHLHDINMLDCMYHEIIKTGFDATCVLLEQEPGKAKDGGCRHYMWRPLLCRLFNYSAVMNKYGKIQYAMCHVIKKKSPELQDIMKDKISKDLQVPINSSLTMTLAQLNPYLSSKRYGINEALYRAIEYVGFKLSRIADEGENNLHDDPPEKHGPGGKKIA